MYAFSPHHSISVDYDDWMLENVADVAVVQCTNLYEIKLTRRSKRRRREGRKKNCDGSQVTCGKEKEGQHNISQSHQPLSFFRLQWMPIPSAAGTAEYSGSELTDQ